MRSTTSRPLASRYGEFLIGAALGFAGGLLLPDRRSGAARVGPAAPRPIEVPIRAPHEEPVRLPLRHAA
ncbi:hypothetical protein ABH926_006449 [Catenulispora sp. GP43]|uniref:hypothetical protein n=1 Tax=Catenulispora sp. GP43 TaxID=3156263 RepID=UPI00351648B2